MDCDNTVPISEKPTESTIPLPKFIAYAFHRNRLPPSVAYHSLFLSRLKSRYPATSYAFSHRIFLTSCMVSSKVIYDDTYLRRNMGIALPGYPRVIPVCSRVPAYVIPAGITTG